MATPLRLRCLISSLALLLLCVSSGRCDNPKENVDELFVVRQSGNGNVIVDDVLTNLKENKSAELDPYLLPNTTIGTWYKLLFVNYTGQIELHSGYVTGISTIRRTGDSDMKFVDGKIHVDAKMGIDNLHAFYLARVTLMSYGPTITIKADAKWAGIDMDLIMEKGKSKLHDLRLHELTGFKVNIEGLGPLNFMFNTLSKVIVIVLKRTVRKMVQYALRKGVADVLQELP